MFSQVDWISFTLPLSLSDDPSISELIAAITTAFEGRDPDLWDALGFTGGVRPGRGRKPYSHSWKPDGGGITLYASPNQPHCLVEISGAGCQYLEDQNLLLKVITLVSDRVSRIDLAADFESEVRPVVFAVARTPGRFKSESFVTSPTGETCYVGSKTSDRYARVYRYEPPHERAHLLRCEMVFRKQQAKIVAQAVLNDGVYAATRSAGSVYGWSHDLWTSAATAAPALKAWRPERHGGKTAAWIFSTVGPALVKAHNEGLIDIFEFWKEYIEPKLDGPN